jgi:hypothetical protein
VLLLFSPVMVLLALLEVLACTYNTLMHPQHLKQEKNHHPKLESA